MRVVVLGAGGIGAGIGGLLAASGTETVLIARGEHAAVMAAEGLLLRTPSSERRLRTAVVTRPDAVAWRGGDVVLLATKLGDAAAALDALLAAAGPEVPVFTAQNGLAGAVMAAERFSTVAEVMVWMPALFLEPGIVELHGEPPGVLELGGAGPCAALSAALRRAGFRSRVHAAISEAILGKLLTNLGGVAQALSGDDPGWVDVAQAAEAEGAAILAAAGLSAEDPDALRSRCMAEMTMGVIGGRHRPGGSTWQSVARGRALESPWLNGEIVRIAASIGREAPINRRLCACSLRPPATPGSEPAASLLP